MVQEFGGKAAFVAENYGDSERSRRFGVTRYPAIFVDDVLVATPKDFGFFGKGEGADEGRYAPLRKAESHERFRADLRLMIERVLAGRGDLARAAAATPDTGRPAALPPLALVDLDGRPLAPETLAGRAVAVEFWATWCPPCRGTLKALGDLERKFGDRLTVIAVAVESDSARVRQTARDLGLPLTWTIATPEVVRAFGGVGAVPTLHLYGPDGRAAGSWYGAPPGLHAEVERALGSLLE